MMMMMMVKVMAVTSLFATNSSATMVMVWSFFTPMRGLGTGTAYCTSILVTLSYVEQTTELSLETAQSFSPP